MTVNVGEQVGTGTRPSTILFVDDDAFMHETLQLFLRDTEYTLISAKNVKEAMRLITSAKPDIIITDAMMPGESGFSLIERLKSQPETSNIPIILWTILEEVNGAVMDASRKADISITKPFYRSDILATLEEAKRMNEFRITVGEGKAEAD